MSKAVVRSRNKKNNERNKNIKVYHSNGTDTWSNDAKEQFSLDRDSEVYDEYRDDMQLTYEKPDDEWHAQLEKSNEMKVFKEIESDDLDEVYAQAHKRFNRNLKMNKNKKIEAVLSNGLGYHVNVFNSSHDEFANDSVLPVKADSLISSLPVKDYEADVIDDYSKDIMSQVDSIVNSDPNGDGRVDGNDEDYVPKSLRSLQKYC